mgnify:FL=1
MQHPMERQRKQAQRTFFAAQWTTHRVVRSEAERTGLLRKAFPVYTPINAPLSNAGAQSGYLRTFGAAGRRLPGTPDSPYRPLLRMGELAPCGSTHP